MDDMYAYTGTCVRFYAHLPPRVPRRKQVCTLREEEKLRLEGEVSRDRGVEEQGRTGSGRTVVNQDPQRRTRLVRQPFAPLAILARNALWHNRPPTIFARNLYPPCKRPATLNARPLRSSQQTLAPVGERLRATSRSISRLKSMVSSMRPPAFYAENHCVHHANARLP